MSYDIDFRVKVEGTKQYISVGDCNANITYNVGDIIRQSTGLEWNNTENNGLCIDIIPALQKGVSELIAHPEKYRHLEPDNGWGSVEGTIRFFNTVIQDWTNYVNQQEPEIVAVTTFWIV